ncbi:MAG: TonB-dependent receptor, partial [Gemmatimonadota bacterium]|nr:TonB-dependent receptor [Gemmatimonadota bacterium]
MCTIPARVNVAHWVVAVLISILTLSPWTPEIAAQEPLDSVIPLAPLVVNVLRTPIQQNASPLAVSAIGEGDIQRGRSGFFIEEALQGLPGVQVQNRFNPAVGERVAIRGFGARAQFGLRGIRVVVDGIPATLPDGQSSLDHLDVGSLARVEAIRGPASALYGNASGGVLSFTSRTPPNTPYNMEVMGVRGSDGLWRGQLTASGTVNETSYFITVSGQTWNGARTIATNAARPRADTLCAGGADAGAVSGRTGCYGGSDRLGLNARLTTPMAGGELSLTANVLDLDAQNAGSKKAGTTTFREINDLYLRFRTGKTLQQQQAGLRWTGPFGGSMEADFSLYGIHRTINNPIPFDVIDLARKAGGARASLSKTVSTGAGELQWLVGGEYELQSDDRSEIDAQFGTGMPDPTDVPFQDQDEDVRSAGVFLQGSLELSGGAVLLTGLRYDNHDFTVTDNVPVAVNADDSGTRTMTAVSPSIGISIPAGQSANVYGSVSTVFNTPTTSELGNTPTAAGGFNADLDPMRGESFEVGVRGNVGSSAAFEVTGYQTNLRNELVRFEVPALTDISFWRNSGKSRHRGVEVTLSVAPGDGLFRGDVTYTRTDAEFLEYAADGNDFAGNRIPGVARDRAQARLRVTPSGWWAELVGSHVSRVQANDANSAEAPSYQLADLRVGLEEVAMGGMNVSPWV